MANEELIDLWSKTIGKGSPQMRTTLLVLPVLLLVLCSHCAETRQQEGEATFFAGTVTEVRTLGGVLVVKTSDSPMGMAVLGGLAAGAVGAVAGAGMAEPESSRSVTGITACTVALKLSDGSHKVFTWTTDPGESHYNREYREQTSRCALLILGDRVDIAKYYWSSGATIWKIKREGEE